MVKPIHSISIGLVALVLATPAIGYFQIEGEIEMPPAQFDHLPTTNFEVSFWPGDDINYLCDTSSALIEQGYTQVACTDHIERKVYIRDDISPEQLPLVIRHEFGHLNGWRH